jgi:hypothetical protein
MVKKMSSVPPIVSGTPTVSFPVNTTQVVKVPTDFGRTIKAGAEDQFATVIETPMCPAERLMLFDEGEQRAKFTDMSSLSLQRCMVQGIETRAICSEAPYAIQAQIGHKYNSARSCMKYGNTYSFLIPPGVKGTGPESHFETAAARAQLELFTKYGHLDKDGILGRVNPDISKANACKDTAVVVTVNPEFVSLHVTHPIAAIIVKRACHVGPDGSFSVTNPEEFDRLKKSYEPTHNTFTYPYADFVKEVNSLDEHVLQKLRTDSLTDISLTLQRSQEVGAKTVTKDATTGSNAFGKPLSSANHPTFGDTIGCSNPHGIPTSKLINEHTSYGVSCHVELKIAVLSKGKVDVSRENLQTLEGVGKTYYALYPTTEM